MTDRQEIARELEGVLQTRRATWSKRLEKIQGDRRRAGGALDPDFDEQAIERENDETLDALDERGRQEVAAIDAALDRIRAGTYGECVRCGEAIPVARLRAQPEAIDCVACAS